MAPSNPTPTPSIVGPPNFPIDNAIASTLGATDLGTVLSLLGADAIHGIISVGFVNPVRMAATGLSPAGAVFTMLEYFKMGVGMEVSRRLGFNLGSRHEMRAYLDYWWSRSGFWGEEDSLVRLCRLIAPNGERLVMRKEGRPQVRRRAMAAMFACVLLAYSVPVIVTALYVPQTVSRWPLIGPMCLLAISLAALPVVCFFGQTVKVSDGIQDPQETLTRYSKDWSIRAIGGISLPEGTCQHGAGFGLQLRWTWKGYKWLVVFLSVTGAISLVWLISRMGSVLVSQVSLTWAIWFAGTAIFRSLAWFLTAKTEEQLQKILVLGLIEPDHHRSAYVKMPITPFEAMVDWCMGPDMAARGVLVQYDGAAVISIGVGRDHRSVFCIAGVPASLSECVFDIRDIIFLLREGDNPSHFLPGGKLLLPMQEIAAVLQSKRVGLARLLLAYAASSETTEAFHLWQLVVYLINTAGCRTALGFEFDRCVSTSTELDTLLQPLYAMEKQSQAALIRGLLVSSAFATDYVCYGYTVRPSMIWVATQLSVPPLPPFPYDVLGPQGVDYKSINVNLVSARTECRVFTEWTRDSMRTEWFEVGAAGSLERMVQAAGVCGSRGHFHAEPRTYTITLSMPSHLVGDLPTLGIDSWNTSEQYPGLCWFSDVPETARPRISKVTCQSTILE